MLSRLAAGFALIAIVVTLAFTLAPNANAQSSSIVGAWMISSVHLEEGDDILDPEPSLIIFTEDGFYSHLQLRRGRVEVAAGTNFADVTDEQKLNAYETITANAGTFTVDGDTVTRHVYIRKNPVAIANFPDNGQPVRFSVENDTLTVYNPNNGNYTVHTRADLK